MNRRNILYQCWLLFLYVAMLSLLCAPLRAQQPLNTLTFKATHNSYACCGGGNSCPVMHNSPPEQIDDWGVWALELDFSVKLENGIPRLIVGHDKDDTYTDPNWGKYLDEFLTKINSSRSIRFHPVFIYFEKKNWGDPTLPWNTLLDDLIVKIFRRENIFGPDALRSKGYNWPTVPDLAGKIIPIAILYDNNGAIATDLHFLDDHNKLVDNYGVEHRFTRVGPFDEYTDSTEVAAQKADVQKKGYTGIILASDQYQENWTFSLVVPPNPLYIKNNAPLFSQVINTEGKICTPSILKPCWDPTDPQCPFQVRQHGTFRFPYSTVSQAYNKAKDFPGWTILINAGSYPEKMVIDKPVTLKSDGGTVIIGR